jgi:hypothetical protein
MTSKIFGAALLIVLGGLGGYVVALNPHIVNYFRGQQPVVRPVQMDELPPRLDPEMKYRLQERCADRAKTLFETDYNLGVGGIISNYENHFNASLDKCFMLVWTKDITKGEAKTITLELIDAIENRRYGFWSSSDCEVRDQYCRTESEWWELVQPYLEKLAPP